MPAEPDSGRRRVFLHIGVPKTGTTFVQDVLWRGRSVLARDGVCYPPRRRGEHFAAAMDLRGASWGGRRNPAWDGTWDRLARTVTESDAATGIVSGELLAAADADAVHRAVASFPDHEVHVVLTVRDLARQLVSGWQEQVKHRVALPLEAFVGGCLGDEAASERASRLGARFWLLHDLPDVAARWAAPVGPACVHLVTVPPPGGPRGQLWQRFAEVTGVDPALGAVDTARPNTSLAAPEAELLRRYNAAHADDVSALHYDQLVRALLAERVLAGGGAVGPAEGDPLVLPARHAAAVHERSRQAVVALSASGYDVAGDLADLVPDPDVLRAARPPVVDDAALAAAGVRATAGLLAELGPLQRRLRSRRGAAAPRSAHRSAPRSAERDVSVPTRRGSRPAPSRSPPGTEPGPVYLHVGAPKTGTTFLQDVLWQHRDRLARDGVLFARRAYDDHFHASLDLRAAPDRTPRSAGVWERVAADTRAWAGTSVVSHELFASARPDHVARALRDMGADRVHVVYTVRDLWRLLGAEWQESTKHGRSLSFADYLDDVLGRGRDGVVGRWFWSVHDPVDVLRRWGADLPPERVHVVTVPPAGSDPALLWRRFAGLVGVDPAVVDTSVARPNVSLGPQEVTFLRLVNARIGGRRSRLLGAGEYPRFVKQLLAQEVLTGRSGATRYAPPPERFEQTLAWAESFVASLGAAGYDVVGDLDDLVPAGPGEPVPDPDTTSDADLAAVAVDALAGLVERAARMREQHGFGVEPRGPRSRPGATAPSRGRSTARRVVRALRRRYGRVLP